MNNSGFKKIPVNDLHTLARYLKIRRHNLVPIDGNGSPIGQCQLHKRDSYTKANGSGKEAQKGTMGLIDIGLPQCKNKVNSNSKARIESKIQ